MRKSLLIALLAFLPAAAQPPRTDSRPVPQRMQNASAPSHVYTRGDVEILTYESEEACNRLQELYHNQNSQPTPGEMAARYYLASTDGSVQPYAVRLPNSFASGRKYPLVIQLHGLNFKEVLFGSRVMYRGMAGPMWIQPDLPVIYGQCFGRPSTFYYGMGEMDVLDVIAEMKRQFPVDPDRVFIMGHSMGGAGSYTVGLHHPDMFGGIMPLDPALWIRPDEMPQVDGAASRHHVRAEALPQRPQRGRVLQERRRGHPEAIPPNSTTGSWPRAVSPPASRCPASRTTSGMSTRTPISSPS